MDLKAIVLEEHSKAQTMRIVRYIGNDPNRFGELMALYFDENNRISQRASWPAGYCAVAHPELIYPYLKKMVSQLDLPVHNAIKRNTTRILAEIDIPEELLGEVADLCFRFLDDPKEAIAVRAFSMSVCFNITRREPELANELKIILEDHFPHSSAGFKARAKRILKELGKMETNKQS